MLAVIDGVIAGVLVGLMALAAGGDTPIAIASGVALGLVTVAFLAMYQYRGVVRPRGRRGARFPEGPPTD